MWKIIDVKYLFICGEKCNFAAIFTEKNVILNINFQEKNVSHKD